MLGDDVWSRVGKTNSYGFGEFIIIKFVIRNRIMFINELYSYKTVSNNNTCNIFEYYKLFVCFKKLYINESPIWP